ncbi:hypothetical protein CVU37_01645 [candidate division BRC1 bacterium HGW-BRC1-1]|jgi:hypothetical protein|nr:MAG: hypothetical protein CVU37_01645 [candidate division BRC1 bacterium HGW-BRC1-1]
MANSDKKQLVRGQATFAPTRVVLMVLVTILLLLACVIILMADSPSAPVAFWWTGWGAIVAAIGSSYCLWNN